MRIQSVRIQNFRSFEDETIEFSDYTCLVGANGSGKSNVFHALNVFFHEAQTPGLDVQALSEEDFHRKNTKDPVVITITFADLSAETQQDFAHYYRQGQLLVSAAADFDPATRKAEVRQFGQRLAMKAFAPFFKADGDKKRVAELKSIYEDIRKSFGDLPPPSSKDSMIDALRSYEANHAEACEAIPSEDQFYGVSKGTNLMEKHIQWVYVPAVKDASTEQIEARNTALGKLLARTVRARLKFDDSIKQLRSEAQTRYQDLLIQSQAALKEISEALKARLADWAHPDATLRLEWRQDPDKSVRIEEPFAQIIAGEGGFEGELPRFGHGLQRSYLLALLQELAGSDTAGGPRLVLVCEEPELYQHPPQARHLYNVLLKLSGGNSQVVVSTHSPYFVSGKDFESIRCVQKTQGRSRVFQAKPQEVAEAIGRSRGEPPIRPSGELAKVHQALQPALSELFFAPKVVLVEGLEDVAYITTYLHLLGLWDQYRRLGCHIVPTDGKGELIQPIAIGKCLRIPLFVVLDSDADKPDKDGSKEKHRKDNMTILTLCDIHNPDPFPSHTLWAPGVVMWASEIENVVKEEIGPEAWLKVRVETDSEYGHTGGLRKNTLHIATSLLKAWETGKKSGSLERLCREIIKFADKDV